MMLLGSYAIRATKTLQVNSTDASGLVKMLCHVAAGAQLTVTMNSLSDYTAGKSDVILERPLADFSIDNSASTFAVTHEYYMNGIPSMTVLATNGDCQVQFIQVLNI